jgi:hypothetical protein
MISDQEISRAEKEGLSFRPAIVAARYLADSDKIEIETPWCTIVIRREAIPELRDVTPEQMESLSVSAVGLHVEAADVDINGAGLITTISQGLQAQVANSF